MVTKSFSLPWDLSQQGMEAQQWFMGFGSRLNTVKRMPSFVYHVYSQCQSFFLFQPTEKDSSAKLIELHSKYTTFDEKELSKSDSLRKNYLRSYKQYCNTAIQLYLFWIERKFSSLLRHIEIIDLIDVTVICSRNELFLL